MLILKRQRKLPMTLTIISSGDFFFSGCAFLLYIIRNIIIMDPRPKMTVVRMKTL